MRCPKHEWKALMRMPQDAGEACTFALHSYGRYVRCQHCNLIGRAISSYRGAFDVLNSYGQARWEAIAKEWNDAAV